MNSACVRYFYDIENCRIPKKYKKNLLKVVDRLSEKFCNYGKEEQLYIACAQEYMDVFSQPHYDYDKFEIIIDHASSEKQAADKLIIQQMNEWSGKGYNAKVFVLISGDGDFLETVKELVQKGHKVVVVHRRYDMDWRLATAASEEYSFYKVVAS